MSNTKEAVSQIQANMGKLAKECPEFMKSFQQMMQTIEGSGVIDIKTLELILIGIAVAKQCGYCIELHVAKALKAGVSRAEILAAGQVAVLMGGGPSLMYMLQVLQKALDDLAE